MRTTNPCSSVTWLAVVALALAGCESLQPAEPKARQIEPAAPVTGPSYRESPGALARAAEDAPVDAPGGLDKAPIERMGTGQLVNSRPLPANAVDITDGGDFNLNFEDTDLRQVVAVVLGQLLGETYYLDPAVKGTVTAQNSRPLTRRQLLPILEALLQMNGAALVRADTGYKIVPMAAAAARSLSAVTGREPLPPGAGFTIQVIPLRFASAEEVQKILEPYVPEGGSLRAVPERNVLILAAPGEDVSDFLATVDVFDADWLKGMSMGMYPLVYADAVQVTEELNVILGTGDEPASPLAGVVRLFPIERLNAVLVVTAQRRYLQEVKVWLEELDRGGAGVGRRLFVYDVKNAKSANIANVLNETFAEVPPAAPAPPPAAALAPGLEPVTIATPPPAAQPPTPVDVQTTQSPDFVPAPGYAPVTPAPAVPSGTGPVIAAANLGPVRIISDDVNNALLVWATPAEYAVIEAAIRRLDILPRQVLVEATIAEVTLNDNLRYGVQWFIKASVGAYSVEFRSLTGESVDLPRATTPGFSSSVFKNPASVRLFIDALETASKLRVLSTPQLLVTDNQTANIRVGTQVPITTRAATSAQVGDAIIQEVEYRDTGVLLTVTPRINAGGMVTMEISQEVSTVGPVVGASGNVSIDQRAIDSAIAVRSGETIVLGGLIQDRKTDSTTGIPILSRIPVFGALFGSTTDDVSRTELIVLITPIVVSNPEEAREVTRELRERLKAADELREL